MIIVCSCFIFCLDEALSNRGERRKAERNVNVQETRDRYNNDGTSSRKETSRIQLLAESSCIDEFVSVESAAKNRDEEEKQHDE